MIAKPNESVLKVGSALLASPDSFSLHLKKNHRLDFYSHNDAIYYLVSGCISIYRVSDNVLTIDMQPPALIGLTQLRNHYRYHYARCSEDCVVWAIEKSKAEALFDKNELWKYAYDFLAYLTNIYHHREIMTCKKSVNEIVLQHLSFIWEMPIEERERTSIYSFILKRNHISRSAIHKVIHDLVNLKVIAVNRGKLTMMSVDSSYNER